MHTAFILIRDWLLMQPVICIAWAWLLSGRRAAGGN